MIGRWVIAPGAAFADVADSQSPWRLTFAAFRDRLNALAEEHGIGGRVTTTDVDQQESLAVLTPDR